MTLRHAAIFLSVVLLCPAGAWGQTVYVSNSNSSNLSIIDTATDTVSATVRVFGENEGVGVTPDGSEVFVANDLNLGSVSEVDTETELSQGSLLVGAGPRTAVVTPDGKTVYVTNSLGAGTISVIDVATWTVTHTISDPGFATGEVLSPDGSRLYVANETSGDVSIISTATNTTVGSIPIGAATAPIGVTISPNSRTLYVSYFSNTVAVVDLATGRVATTIKVGNISSPYANGLAVTPNGRTLFIANKNDGTVSAVDTATNTVVATIPVGKNPVVLAITPDGGKVYVANYSDNTVSVISTASNTVVGRPIAVGTNPTGIAIGPTPPPPPLVAAVLPGSRSVLSSKPATVFATIINTSANTVTGCRVAIPFGAAGTFNLSYQTTDPITNALTGTPNQPVTLQPGGSQSFLLSVTLNNGFGTFTHQGLDFSCGGTLPARSVVGVNTLDLSFSLSPTPDVIVLGATPSADGILDIAGSNAAAAFGVATINIGSSANMTVTADTGGISLPLALTVCQTNPTTGSCLSPPSASLQPMIVSNATPTFSVFATASGPISLVPAVNRIFLRFTDQSGVSRGSTSVAVRTQ